MKKFILKVVAAAFVCMSLSLFVYLQFFFKQGDVNLELAMQLASKKYPFVIKKIRIGDSVGRQFHDTGTEPDSGIVNLTSNFAASLLSNYLLLRKITTVNKDNLSDSLEIEGFFRPTSITYNLDGSTATNYFLKNFYSNQWFFDTTLIDAGTAGHLDSVFLDKYPKRKIIKNLIALSAISKLVHIPGVLNPPVPVKPNTQSLADALAPSMHRFFPRYQTIYCPVSTSKAKTEVRHASEIHTLWKAKKPVRILDDSLFMRDKIHLLNKI